MEKVKEDDICIIKAFETNNFSNVRDNDKYKMDYATFTLTDEQKDQKEQENVRHSAKQKADIDKFIQTHGLVNKRPTQILDGSSFYDCQKTGERYRISYFNNYIVNESKSQEGLELNLILT